MKLSIRGRITAWVFAVFLAGVTLEGALLLGGLSGAITRVLDWELHEDLDELSSDVADTTLVGLLGSGYDASEWSDVVFEMRDLLDERIGSEPLEKLLFYEIRRSTGQLIAQSDNLAGRSFGRRGEPASRDAVSYRYESDPEHGRLRIAELSAGPYRVQIARRAAVLSALLTSLQAQMFAILAGVSIVGAIGAYLISTRALSPVRKLVDEARRLQTTSAGVLPRSGRADEVDQLAEVLNQLLVRVRVEVERIRQFTADAAHEIRTPLAAIQGHLELLLGRAGSDDEAVICGVLEEVERLTRLVNQMLQLEKLESSPELRRERVDLGRLTRGLVEHLGVVADERGIALDCACETALVRGDPGGLRQVLLNLLDNAFRHTPAGGKVSVRVDVWGEKARAVVLDSGPGISAQDLERIFERFSSVESGVAGGLGLTIARAIARAHGGDLRAASPGGAAFTLELPLIRDF